MSTSGLSQKQQVSSQPHFWAVRKFLWKMVKNCVRNRSRMKFDTETEICTSLKSKFYFRFRWPPSTIKSTLISYITVRVYVMIRGKICPPQSQNCQNPILHISKICNLLPVCLINNSLRNNQNSERHAQFGENRSQIADVIIRRPICGQTYTHTDRQKPKWLDSLSNAFDRQ